MLKLSLFRRQIAALLIVMILATLSVSYSASLELVNELAIFEVFDYDDTIIFTTSKLYIYDQAGNEIAVSTKDFAEIGELVGKDLHLSKKLISRLNPDLAAYFLSNNIVNLKAYQLDSTENGSFREFGDISGDNPFLKKLIETLKLRTEEQWRGPRATAFFKRCETQAGADKTFILSARRHSPETVMIGLRLLQKLGYIQYLPPIRNIILVGGDNHTELGATAEERKKNALIELLDQLQKTVKDLGLEKGSLTFSDDDYQNIEKIIEGLENILKRWPNVEVIMDYVGEVNPNHEAYQMLLKFRGSSMNCREAFQN